MWIGNSLPRQIPGSPAERALCSALRFLKHCVASGLESFGEILLQFSPPNSDENNVRRKELLGQALQVTDFPDAVLAKQTPVELKLDPETTNLFFSNSSAPAWRNLGSRTVTDQAFHGLAGANFFRSPRAGAQIPRLHRCLGRNRRRAQRVKDCG